MHDQLTGHGAAAAEANAIDHVVQAALQQNQQILAGDALLTVGFFEIMMELVLQNAISALRLLLLTQLQAVLAHLALARLTMLSGRSGALANGAIRAIAFFALQKELATFTTAEAANGTGISCHLFVPPITLFCAWADGIHCAGSASRP